MKNKIIENQLWDRMKNMKWIIGNETDWDKENLTKAQRK